MSEKRYAILDGSGRCVNTILWDDQKNPNWQPPPGHTVVQSDTMQVEPPPAPPEKPEPPPIQE